MTDGTNWRCTKGPYLRSRCIRSGIPETATSIYHLSTIMKLQSCYDVADASIYSGGAVFTAQALCTDCDEPYLHCLRMAGGAVRSRQRPGLQPTVREQREADPFDYAVFPRDRVTAESRFTLRVKLIAAVDTQCVGVLASAEIVNHDSKIHKTSPL
jgi:hypothetical protein